MLDVVPQSSGVYARKGVGLPKGYTPGQMRLRVAKARCPLGERLLALPNVLTAGAADGVGGSRFNELLSADRARLGHHIGHNRYSSVELQRTELMVARGVPQLEELGQPPPSNGSK